MRNVPLDALDHLPVDVLPLGTDYPPDHLLARHTHRRAQLLHGASGVMRLETEEGAWTVPVDRAVCIPPGTPHEVHMRGVTTWSLYIEPDAVPWWPTSCTVIEVGPLLRELLRAANDLGADYDTAGRDGALIGLLLHELRRTAPAPFVVSLPREEPFRALCRAYLAAPDAALTNTDWARAAAMSPRTFDRRFHALTGTSPATWRARARLLAALPLLPAHSVTSVAARLGYSSPAAFTAAFTRAFGAPPSKLG
ncbi:MULTISPECIES: AraC family transcriptional regulator [Streptomyces]|uniref:Helix-turn-helix transcriptional regulator n=1 Tax=Streptomyces evansiae TaxID=3075535 RepID=A0ABU2QZY4_9ACTN|nr:MULTISPECIES: helix-turn-helix transcriptional regulator [unclassified Streptomyces]MDT0410004.1 helix-turn-helix transcriptional regulator [Streptomyces sp. DSM 41979]MYQ56097.1 helix-turn-helix domain-containing protein [Streptomyces sp. SID4926]WEH25857.1 helix-turn-helix transcriptional regulator [Streptomyces sp. AM 3-1-1]SCE41825.1 AraC-type DNA-binding protein [Streptomyces sp. DfronAA-171]